MDWKKFYKRCDDPVECVRSFMTEFDKDLLKIKGAAVILCYKNQAKAMASVDREFLHGRKLNSNWFEHCVSDMMLQVAEATGAVEKTNKNLEVLFGKLPETDEVVQCLYTYRCVNGDIKILLDVVFPFMAGQVFRSSKKFTEWAVVHVSDKIVLYNGVRNMTMSRGRVLDMEYVSRGTF